MARISAVLKAVVLIGTLLCLIGWLYPGGVVLAQWDEPPPEEEWPSEEVPGEETEKGMEFETPFIVGVSSLLLEVLDCETGKPVEGSTLRTQFIFFPDAEKPFSYEDLEFIIVEADDYIPAVVSDFKTFQFGIGFVQFTVLTADPICLLRVPADGEGTNYFVPGDDLNLSFSLPPKEEGPTPANPVIHPPTPPPPPVQPIGECGAYETQQKAYKATYAYVPGGVTVDCHTKPNGALETTFTFRVKRTVYWKARHRGPCTLDAGHPGRHSPWRWSGWKRNGTTVSEVTMTKTIGGCPTGMSASYFKRWLIAFGYADLAASHRIHPAYGLGNLRYVETGYDPRSFYETYIKPLLRTNTP